MKNGMKCVTDFVPETVVQNTHSDFFIHLLSLSRFQFLAYVFQIYQSSVLKNLNIDPQNVSQKNKKRSIKSLVSLENTDLV